jgi:hypothetical protein
MSELTAMARALVIVAGSVTPAVEEQLNHRAAELLPGSPEKATQLVARVLMDCGLAAHAQILSSEDASTRELPTREANGSPSQLEGVFGAGGKVASSETASPSRSAAPSSEPGIEGGERSALEATQRRVDSDSGRSKVQKALVELSNFVVVFVALPVAFGTALLSLTLGFGLKGETHFYLLNQLNQLNQLMWADTATAPIWQIGLRLLGQVAAATYAVSFFVGIVVFLVGNVWEPITAVDMVVWWVWIVAGCSALVLALPLGIISDSPTLGWFLASLGVAPICFALGVGIDQWLDGATSGSRSP